MRADASKLGKYKRYLTGVLNFKMLASEMWTNETESVNLRARVTEYNESGVRVPKRLLKCGFLL